MNERDDTAQEWAKPYEVRIAVLEERVRNSEKATALQAAEYQRRLHELNHAHEKQVADQATYISLDKFDGFVLESTAWRAAVNETLAVLKGREKGGQPLRDLVMVVAGALLSYIAQKLLT